MSKILQLVSAMFHGLIVPETAKAERFDDEIVRTSLGKPAYNPGRTDSASWGRPCEEIPPEFCNGFDPALGLMRFMPLPDAAKLFAELVAKHGIGERVETVATWERFAKDPKAEIKRQRKALAQLCYENESEQLKFRVADATATETAQFLTISFRSIGDVYAKMAEITPKYIAISGQRRANGAAALLAYLAERDGMPIIASDELPDYLWHGIETKYTSVAELLDTIAGENKSTGRRDYSPVGRAVLACKRVLATPTIRQEALGRLVGFVDTPDPITGKTKNHNGNRASIQRLAQFNRQFSALDVMDRLQLRHTDPFFLDVTKLMSSSCREEYPVIMGDVPGGESKNRQRVRKYLASVIDGYNPNVEITPTDDIAEGWLKVVHEEKSSRLTNCYGAKDIKNLLKDKALEAKQASVAAVLRAVLDGNDSFFTS